jgi:hypothetical protein
MLLGAVSTCHLATIPKMSLIKNLIHHLLARWHNYILLEVCKMKTAVSSIQQDKPWEKRFRLHCDNSTSLQADNIVGDIITDSKRQKGHVDRMRLVALDTMGL